MGAGVRVDLSAFDLQVNAIDGDKAFELFDEVSGCPYEFLAHVGGSVSFISNQATGDFKSRSFHSGGFLQRKCQFGCMVIPWFVKQVSAAGLNTSQSTWFSMRCTVKRYFAVLARPALATRFSAPCRNCF
jgi:hypothetical protein